MHGNSKIQFMILIVSLYNDTMQLNFADNNQTAVHTLITQKVTF